MSVVLKFLHCQTISLDRVKVKLYLINSLTTKGPILHTYLLTVRHPKDVFYVLTQKFFF